jgi:hypothetical protein
MNEFNNMQLIKINSISFEKKTLGSTLKFEITEPKDFTCQNVEASIMNFHNEIGKFSKSWLELFAPDTKIFINGTLRVSFEDKDIKPLKMILRDNSTLIIPALSSIEFDGKFDLLKLLKGEIIKIENEEEVYINSIEDLIKKVKPVE